MANNKQPGHTCVDRPHLPCDACGFISTLAQGQKVEYANPAFESYSRYQRVIIEEDDMERARR